VIEAGSRRGASHLLIGLVDGERTLDQTRGLRPENARQGLRYAGSCGMLYLLLRSAGHGPPHRARLSQRSEPPAAAIKILRAAGSGSRTLGEEAEPLIELAASIKRRIRRADRNRGAIGPHRTAPSVSMPKVGVYDQKPRNGTSVTR